MFKSDFKKSPKTQDHKNKKRFPPFDPEVSAFLHFAFGMSMFSNASAAALHGTHYGFV